MPRILLSLGIRALVLVAFAFAGMLGAAGYHAFAQSETSSLLAALALFLAGGGAIWVAGERFFLRRRRTIEFKEGRLARSNRALRVLSAANRTVVRATDEKALLNAMCQQIVEVGGYRLAWVGYARHDEAKSVHPAAQAGTGMSYLDRIDITWADLERGRGPVGTAIREGRPVVVRHIQTDPAFGPWRDEALKHGFASVIALPVRDREGVVGSLNIHSSEPDAFDAEEIELLEEMTSNLGYGIASLREAAARARAEGDLEYQHNHDPLTGLANRNLLQERLLQATVRFSRAGRLVAVVLMGMDRFKMINESLGHSIGDTLLKQVGQRLADCVRDGDTVARFSSDEFAVVLSDLAKEEDVVPIARKLLAAVVQALGMTKPEVHTSASMGISLFPKDGKDAGRLLQNAGAAMHSAKALGGNAFRFYAPEMNERTAARFAMDAALRRALERGELLLYFQPLVSLVSGRQTGAEALLRWHRPEIGLVPPGDFIPLAEETELIHPIGEWVIENVCRQLRIWLDAGLPVVPVAVNLSARQFRQENLARLIHRSLNDSGLEPKFLVLEITESALMDDVEAAIDILRELKAIGVTLSLDDFGTGYSSLSYLKRFPIDQLKIDQSFVRDVASDPDDAAICTAVIGLAHTLKLNVIAEGVETDEQMNFLRLLLCDEMQGYYFSRPLPAAEYALVLADRKTLELAAATARDWRV